MLMASTEQAVRKVHDAKADPRELSMEQEQARAAQRAQRVPAPLKPPSGEFTFRDYKALPVDHLPDVRPGQAQSLALLHRLAADPGIVGIMTHNRRGSAQVSLYSRASVQPLPTVTGSLWTLLCGSPVQLAKRSQTHVCCVPLLSPEAVS